MKINSSPTDRQLALGKEHCYQDDDDEYEDDDDDDDHYDDHYMASCVEHRGTLALLWWFPFRP